MLTKAARNIHPRGARPQAFTILEVVFAIGIIGFLVVAILAAITSGMTSLRMARENLRATQILVEKTEAIRLYNWDQINAANFLPSTFVVPYDVHAAGTNTGILYFGTIQVSVPPIGTSYTNDLRMVTVSLNWKTGKLNRTRQISTYVCRSGIQNYIY